MSRVTLYQPPESFIQRIEELAAQPDLNPPAAELLLQVELSFALMELLQMDDEPVTAAWTILSGMHIRDLRFQNLPREQRRAIANARQIVPYSSRSAYIDALHSYIIDVPSHWRNYFNDREDFDLQNLRHQILAGRKQVRHQLHQNLYEQCLTSNLSFRHRPTGEIAKAETRYYFEAKTGTDTVGIEISFKEGDISNEGMLSLSYATQPIRQPFTINVPALQTIAEFIDEREKAMNQRYSGENKSIGNWVKRFHTINFHRVHDDGSLGERNAHEFIIDGFTHVAGMVASGKSTLALLLAGYLIREVLGIRLTLVVGDVQTAIRLANQLNWWFRDNPETDEPVAVAIMGRSTRDAHLRAFYASKDYLDHQKRGQPHWGERWLGTACALQTRILNEDWQQKLMGKSITPGQEPCQNLKRLSRNGKVRSGPPDLCPFFEHCPSQQMYRDMPVAKIWITTPGAMAMSSLPHHLESRPIKLGELIYEQSNLVIFDEADTVMQWFDDVYAEQVNLTNNNDGILDKISVPTEEFMVSNRVPPRLTQRWVGAERHTQQAVTATLTMLNKFSGHEILRKWVARGYFTPNALFYKLARRIVGLPEYDPQDISREQLQANEQLTQVVMQYFDTLLNYHDPLNVPESSERSDNEPVYQLSLLMRNINQLGESASDQSIHTRCKWWIEKFFPEIEERLSASASNNSTATNSTNRTIQPVDNNLVETMTTLAYRLQFVLTVTLLDRHIRIVFYEWHNRPITIADEQPHRRMPAAMLDILPLPPTGRQFGTYYAQNNLTSDVVPQNVGNKLALFAYTNIGRCYVLNYHRLLTDFDGRRGPNVLALSGTSYLPDSTSFHVGEPQGILMPEEKASNAISASHFAFLPQLDRRTGEPILISGIPEAQKMGMFKKMALSLVGKNGSGHLGQEVTNLKYLAESNPEIWRDRERILLLVNSYDQAQWAADELRNNWPKMQGAVYHLQRSDKAELAENIVDDDITSSDEQGAINRTDIENFGQTNGKILVAPLNSIGRGFNVLNRHGKAAFGSVYFLTRPYPHPHDTQAIAREINRRALDWVNDPNFSAWQNDGVLARAESVRRKAAMYWRSVEQRSYYRTLLSDPELHAYPRNDLAATTAGYVIQAVGRLLRGGVPFRAYFVDAAWAPKSSKEGTDHDIEETSLLVAMILRMRDYASENEIGRALYGPLADALDKTENLRW